MFDARLPLFWLLQSGLLLLLLSIFTYRFSKKKIAITKKTKPNNSDTDTIQKQTKQFKPNTEKNQTIQLCPQRAHPGKKCRRNCSELQWGKWDSYSLPARCKAWGARKAHPRPFPSIDSDRRVTYKLDIHPSEAWLRLAQGSELSCGCPQRRWWLQPGCLQEGEKSPSQVTSHEGCAASRLRRQTQRGNWLQVSCGGHRWATGI